MNAPLTIEAMADSLRLNFVEHAANYPATLWHEQWTWINRAASVIAGVGIGLALAGDSRSAKEIASGLLALVREELPDRPPFSTFAEGLEVRVMKCFLALEGRAAAADLLKPKQLRALSAELDRQRKAEEVRT